MVRNNSLEEQWAVRRTGSGGSARVGAEPLYVTTYGIGAGPHTHEDQTCGVDGHWAHEDQTLPSGQLGSVNLISVGLSQRSSHLRSHPKYLIRNQLESLLCLPGPGSFPIYIPSLSCWYCTRQRATCIKVSQHTISKA